MLINSVYFGAVISIGGYLIGLYLKEKTKLAIINPLLIAIIISILFLNIFGIDYQSFKADTNILSYLLTPATVCLAIPLYEQMQLLKRNFIAILTSVMVGVLTSCVSIFIMAKLFKLDYIYFVSLLPKSITTAIGIGVAEEFGGIASITAISIIITGVFGNIVIAYFCKWCKIKNQISVGLALGTASHAIGTTKALELGEIEGAMSSLSIAVSGILTVAFAGIFAKLY